MHRKRVERAVSGCRDGGRANFFLERLHQFLTLADAKLSALDNRGRALRQILFARLECLKIAARLRQGGSALREFVLRGGLLRDQHLQRLLGALEALHLKSRGQQIAVELCHQIWSTTSTRVAKLVLRGNQVGASLR